MSEPCWYKLPGTAEWRQGAVRAWSTDYEEFESGPALFPVAVIEDSATGSVRSVYVENVCMSADKPQCSICGGTGSVDSGGFTEQGYSIDVPCQCNE